MANHPTGLPSLSADGAAVPQISAERSGRDLRPGAFEKNKNQDKEEKVRRQTASFVNGHARSTAGQWSMSGRAIEHKIEDKAIEAGHTDTEAAVLSSVKERTDGSWLAYGKHGKDERRRQYEGNANKVSEPKADGIHLQIGSAAANKAPPGAGAPHTDPSISRKELFSAHQPDTAESSKVADEGNMLTLDELIANAKASHTSPVEPSAYHPRRDMAPSAVVNPTSFRGQDTGLIQPKTGHHLPPCFMDPVKKNYLSRTSDRDVRQPRASERYPDAERLALPRSTVGGTAHERTAIRDVGTGVSDAGNDVAICSNRLDQHKTNAPSYVKSTPDLGVESSLKPRTSIKMSHKKKAPRRGQNCIQWRRRKEMAAKLSDAAIWKEDTRSNKRPGADPAVGLDPVNRARTKTEPAVDEIPRPRPALPEPAPQLDPNTPIDLLAKYKAAEYAVAHLNSLCRELQMHFKSRARLSEDPNVKAEQEAWYDYMIIKGNLAMIMLEPYPATSSRLRTLPHGQLKPEFTDYQLNGTSFDR